MGTVADLQLTPLEAAPATLGVSARIMSWGGGRAQGKVGEIGAINAIHNYLHLAQTLSTAKAMHLLVPGRASLVIRLANSSPLQTLSN